MKKKERKPRAAKQTKAVAMLPAPEDVSLPTVPGGQISVDPQMLLVAAVKSNASIEMMNKLMDLRDRIERERAEKEFREAMAAFQAECPVIIRKKKGHQGKYAPIEDIIKQAGPFISKHGFSFSFDSEEIEKKYTSVLYITHSGGHTEKRTFSVGREFATITGVQADGASRTYANRYNFCNGFGIMTADEDTDGVDLEATKKKSAEESANASAIAAAKKKYDALPDYIRDGFKNLGYTFIPAYQFCEDHEWDAERIRKDIDKIADKQRPKA